MPPLGFLSFGVVLQAALFVVGLIWCASMLRRWRTDLVEFRTSADLPERIGIVLPWLITAVVATSVVGFLLTLVGRFELV